MTNNFSLIVFFSIILTFQLNAQQEDDYWLLKERTPKLALKTINGSKLGDSLRISDFVNPFYFEEDLNGDSILDIAILVENKSTSSKGILIIHGTTNEIYQLGAGKTFDNRIDDFSWMDVWKINRNSTIHRLTYKENGDIDSSEEININSPSLEIIQTEASSSNIYWNGFNYVSAQKSE